VCIEAHPFEALFVLASFGSIVASSEKKNTETRLLFRTPQIPHPCRSSVRRVLLRVKIALPSMDGYKIS